MSDDRYRRRTLRDKFRDAFRGAKRGVRGESNFFVHLFMAALVAAVAASLRVPLVEWCLLLLCITIVLTAEMFNTAIERLAKAITERPHPAIRDALDMASAAVLLAAIGAATVGALIFIYRLSELLGWNG